MGNKWQTISKLYIENNLKIFPIIENSKVPRIKAWNEDCSCELMQVLYYYENNKNDNWALPCYENNLFVLDLDTHDVNRNGVISFKNLCKDLGIETPNTLTQETPSGGIHYIFESDDELEQVRGLSNAFQQYPGIDLRNRNYILVEPSCINQKPYKFINNIKPQSMHPKLKKFILENVGTKESNKKIPYEKPKEVYVGDRDNQLFQYITQLYYKTRLDYDEILVLANYFNEEVLEEPFSEKDVKYKVNKAFEKDRGRCIFLYLGKEDNND